MVIDHMVTLPAKVAEVPGPIFWRSPFNAVCGRDQMTEFIVMEIEVISDKDRRHVAGRGTVSQKVCESHDGSRQWCYLKLFVICYVCLGLVGLLI